VLGLNSNSPPSVNTHADDHSERRPNTSDATLVHTPSASIASATSDPRPADGTSQPSSARAHHGKCAAISCDLDRNRRRQSRTVSRGNPKPLPRPPVPLNTHAAQRRPDQPPLHTAGATGTCPGAARASRGTRAHDRQRPRCGRNRRAPAGPDLPQPGTASLPTHPTGNADTAAGRQRSASTTARSSETMSAPSSNGVTGPSPTATSRYR
jgi:hypothetical protein